MNVCVVGGLYRGITSSIDPVNNQSQAQWVNGLFSQHEKLFAVGYESEFAEAGPVGRPIERKFEVF
jgi:hypothetical protein